MCDDGKYLDNNKVTCRNCEAGKVCRLRYENGRVDVTRPGTQFGNYYSPVGVSAQFICPGGFECDNNVANACSAGEYSGEGDLYCRQCPLGWACPTTALDYSLQIDCSTQRGHYGSAGGLTACTPCSAGHYCPRSPHPAANTMVACPAGTWSAPASESCHECPAGYECPSTVKPEMRMCLKGYYSLSGQSSCTECPAGY